jgi:maleate isomerase
MYWRTFIGAVERCALQRAFRRDDMPDVRGWRKKFGVLAPSTNTIVEPDFYMMSVPGVTAHISRIFMANTSRDGETTEATEQRQMRLEQEMQPTIERVCRRSAIMGHF